jgi:hypothetical protein
VAVCAWPCAQLVAYPHGGAGRLEPARYEWAPFLHAAVSCDVAMDRGLERVNRPHAQRYAQQTVDEDGAHAHQAQPTDGAEATRLLPPLRGAARLVAA